MSVERLQPGARMSQAVIHNKTVYLAGQIASGAPAAGVGEQTRDILQRSVWDAWVIAGSAPARTTVMSLQLAASDFKVEIAIIAAQL